MTLKQALDEGFTVNFRPSDIRLGTTIFLRRPIKRLPTFEEGLAAWRENRSVPMSEYCDIVLETPFDIETLMENSVQMFV